MANRTSNDYWKWIEETAQELVEENKDKDVDELQDIAWEYVDGSDWIIYPMYHEIIIDSTDSRPDPQEVRAMTREDADWEDMRAMDAFMSMNNDLIARIRELVEERKNKEE